MTSDPSPSSTSPSGGGKTLAGAALPEAQPPRSPKLALAIGGLALAAGAAIYFGTRGPAESPTPSPSSTATQGAAVSAPPELPKSAETPPTAPVQSVSAAPATSVEIPTATVRPRTPRGTPAVRQPAGHQPNPTPSEPAAPTPQPPRAGELPPVVKKVRTLDADNPFAPKPE
jgi:hypothetical protein